MSFVTVDFPDIRESDSAEYAYLANVYNTTYSHNQNAWRSPDENRLDGTTYAALRSRSVDYRSGFMPDVRVTRVHAFKRHAAVYCETNTGYHYKVECTPLCDTVSNWLTPCLMGQVDTYEWTNQGWDFVRRDYVNLV